MEPYCEGHPLNWFEGNPNCAYSALAMVNTEGNTFSVLMYMKPNFGIKLYDYWAWANELSWTSATPNTLVISEMQTDPETGKTDGNYGNAEGRPARSDHNGEPAVYSWPAESRRA